MFKKYALATTALTFFLLQPDPAAAGPLIGAIAGVFSAVISGSGIVNAVVSLALAAATTLYSMATAPDAPPPVGAKIQADVGDDKPVSTTIGQFATRGKRKYYGTWGNYDGDTPNTYFTEVIELGNLPLPGLDGIWIEGEKCTILWNEPDAVFGRGYPLKEFRDTEGTVHDYCWVKFYDGLHTVADPFLVETFGEDDDRPWDATMIGRGIPYAIMTYRWERDYFKGQPKVLFEPAPLPLYDIRKDSTNGGNGIHRWDDPNTHEPSYNLAVMTYNVLRGLRYKGEWFYGGQKVNARRLPSSNWIAACQEAGRLIERADGSTEPQWRGGYEITGDMVPLTVIEELRKAQNGRLTDQGGVFKMKNGIFGGAVFGFTDADTLITEPAGFDPFPSVDQTINGVTGKYPNPKEAWVAKDAPVVRNDAFEALDGKRNLADISFGATSHDRQVQQLMRAILAEARRFRRHQLPLPPMAYVLEAGIDVVSWTSPHNGYVNKRFLVTERRGQMGMNQIVTLQEIDPTDYDWVRTMQEVVSSGWIGRIDVPVQPMTGWSVRRGTILDPTGKARRPAIFVSCASNLADVARIRVKVRLKSSGDVVFDSDQQPYDQATAEWPLNGSWLLPATAYEVQGKLIPFSSRKTEESEWLPVTTDDIRFSPEDLHLSEVSQAVNTELAQHIDWIWRDDNIRALIESRKSISINLAAQDLANYTDKKEIKREIVSKTGKLQARFQEQIDVATSETAALVQRVVTFEAELDLKASAQLVETTIARVAETEEGLIAVSGRVTEIEAEILDKADASLVETLKTEVQENADGISALSARQLELSAEVEGKASADLVQTTIARVTTSENEISSLSQDMVSLATSLSDKIGSSVFNSLASEVSDIGGVVTLQGDILNEIELELDDKASFLALSTLTGTVTQQGDMITSQGELIDSISAKVGDISADARMRFEVVNANGTGYSLIGLQARFGTQEDYRSAGLFIKVPSDPNQQSEVIVNSGLFAVTTGNDETGQRIFLVEDGKVYLDSAYIKNITTDKVTFLENSVDGDTLALGAAQSIYDNAAVTAVTVTTTFQSVLSVSAPKTETSRIKVLADIRVRATALVSGKATLLVELWENDGAGDAVVKDTTLTFTDVVNSQAPTLYYYRRTGAGTFTYKIVVKKTVAGEDFQIGRRTLTAEAPKRVSS